MYSGTSKTHVHYNETHPHMCRHTHSCSDTPIQKLTHPLMYLVTHPFTHTHLFTYTHTTCYTTLDHHLFFVILVLPQNGTNLPGSVAVFNNSFTPVSKRFLEVSSFFIGQQLFIVIKSNQSYYIRNKMSGVLILSTASQFKHAKLCQTWSIISFSL